MISAILVAAGKSSRMGSMDKLSLPYGDSTILHTVLDNLLASKASKIIVVLGPEARPPIIKNSKIKTVINMSPDAGLTSSIQTGVREAAVNDALMICLGDMPLLDYNNYNKLIDKYLQLESKVIIQPYMNSRPGNPVLFSADFRNDILQEHAPNGCRTIVQANTSSLSKLEVQDQAYFTDIDTQEQYQEIINTGPGELPGPI